MWGGASALAAIGFALIALLTLRVLAAERRALTIAPEGMPVRLEAATFFDDGRVLTWTWRNSTREVLYPRLLVFVFDQRGAFVGSLRRCSAEPLQPGTGGQVRVELEIEGVTSRHRFVALVEQARSDRTIWHVRGYAGDLVEAARRTAAADHAVWTTESRANPDADLTCACDCETAEAAGREGCGAAGLAAFTCTPVFFPGGCSQAFTCR